MRLFGYYALHSVFNQLRKLFKTWVLVLILVCGLIGGLIGMGIATLEDAAEENAAEPAEEIPEEVIDFEPEISIEEEIGISGIEITEMAVAGVVLAVFLYNVFSAESQAGRIFLPADVNLLFASPLKPQSVLMFRLGTQLGMAVVGSIYLLFQIPNLVLNVGVSLPAALSLIAGWCLTLMSGKLLQLLTYLLSSKSRLFKENIHKVLYALIALIGAGFWFCSMRFEGNQVQAAYSFFCAGWTKWIPFWGWIRGFCASALRGELLMTLLFLALLIIGGAVMMELIWRMDVDFYEDAMMKSQEVAELMAARTEKAAFMKRKKDRSEKIERDGFHYGSGANVYFFRTLYNRFRFAHLKYFTKTSEFYLAAGVLAAAFMRFVVKTQNLMPLAAMFAVMVFFRALGNPLSEDTRLDYFRLIPEKTWKKLFWSLLSGSVNCLLDLIPGLLAGALILGVNPLQALVWLPLIVSVDFYSVSIGTFLSLSIPESIGMTIKQTIQILFIYFGLLPDIAVMAIGIVFDYTAAAAFICTVINMYLGILFLGLAGVFVEPCGGRDIETDGSETLQPGTKKIFSAIGLYTGLILAVTSLLQLAAGHLLADYLHSAEQWLFWLTTFLPLYLSVIGGLLLLKKIPSVKLEEHRLPLKYFIIVPVICVFVMYAGNLIGTLVTLALSSLTHTAAENPLSELSGDGTLLQRFVFMVIMAPLVEEYVFRKQLIDRMHVYGGRTAVILSGLMFGLFHGNFSQFFYAAALGIIFGYVYLKTGRLRYTIGLHMFVNFFGGIVGPYLLNNIAGTLSHLNQLLILPLHRILGLPHVLMFIIYIVMLMAMALAGFVLLVKEGREISFTKEELQLPKGKAVAVSCLNPGMVFFTIACAVMFVITLL
jgi:membrane protease YdiL (CAAX protease family)